MIYISLIDYSQLLRLYWFYYIFSIGMLIAVLIWGEKVNGATRWINIPHLFQFQPSEIAKILLILFYAQFIMKYKEKLNTFKILFLCVGLMLPGYLSCIQRAEPVHNDSVLYFILCTDIRGRLELQDHRRRFSCYCSVSGGCFLFGNAAGTAADSELSADPYSGMA